MDACTLLNIAEPDRVKFLVALTFSQKDLITPALDFLYSELGCVDLRANSFAFDHTRYYAEEMGPNLSKQFFAFEGLKDRENLVSVKLLAISAEQEMSVGGKRRVNIDPMYIELPKMVVASSKNFAHRVYIGSGVYGDVQLQYIKGQFVANDWTYPDYNSLDSLSFFEDVRSVYFQQLRRK